IQPLRPAGAAGTVVARGTVTGAEAALVPYWLVAVALSTLAPGTNSTWAEKVPAVPAATSAAATPPRSTCTVLPASAVPETTMLDSRVLVPFAGRVMTGAGGPAWETWIVYC